jgi:hypothetical protein
MPSLASLTLSLDRASAAITEIDFDAINRARALISDTVISELVNEDVRAREAFNDALRHQVVVCCQHVRAHLRVVDRLMDLYNKSIAATPGNKA